MLRSCIQLWLLLLALMPIGQAFAAEGNPPLCVVCGEAVKPGQKYFVYEKHPATKGTVAICTACNELKLHCSKCGLPVKETAEKTEDGRYFCPICVPVTALKDDEIRKTFAAAANALDSLSGGKMRLKNTTVTVNVFDVDYWNSKLGESGKGTMQRHGLSTSRPVGNGLVHTVLLHRGLWKDEMVAVCTHEFTHLWINENKPENRTIEPQTIEAVCEVVALALMEHLQMPSQVTAIMENTYTEGRIKPAAQYYKVHGLNRVLDWVKEGNQPTFDERDFATASMPAPSMNWPLPGVAYKQEFAALKLKGIIGKDEKAVALINDKTFAKGEERKMEIAGKRMLVKLLEIGEDSVTLQVENSKEPVKLNRE